MSKADAVAAILWIGVDALRGLRRRRLRRRDLGAARRRAASAGRGARNRIDRSIAPVWEANHVWLIFILVVLWTGFPEAFSAVMTTLYIPLALAALGIVLRGLGLRLPARRSRRRRGRAATRCSRISSLLTPFFMGTVVGAIASGEVPAEGDGDPIGELDRLPAAAHRGLFVAGGAYIAAVFLVHDATPRGEEGTSGYFGRWALAAAVVAGARRRAGSSPCTRTPASSTTASRAGPAAGDRLGALAGSWRWRCWPGIARTRRSGAGHRRASPAGRRRR